MPPDLARPLRTATATCYRRPVRQPPTPVVLEANDIKEELSVAYVRAVASRAGFAVEEVRRDRDSIDLHVFARGVLDDGPVESPVLDVQLKSTARDLSADEAQIPYDLKVKNYNDLARPTLIPRILVVFFLPEDPQRWLTLTDKALVLRRSAYWMSLKGRPPTSNKDTARVHLLRSQVFDPTSIRAILGRIAREEAITP